MNNSSAARMDLSSSNLINLIAGNLRENLYYSRCYLYHHGPGTQILIENYDIAPDTSGVVNIQHAASPLLLIFRNCTIKQLEINHEISDLRFENCEIDTLIFSSGKIGKLSITKESGKIEKILTKENTIGEFDFNCSIGKLIFESSGKQIDGRLSGDIDFLDIQDNKNLSLVSFGIIGECQITYASYPFRNAPIFIKKLKIVSGSLPSIELCGFFESIELLNVLGPVIVHSLICLKDFVIKNNRGNSTQIGLSNTYVGGDFVIKNATPELSTAIEGEINKFVYINRLLLKNSLSVLKLSNTEGLTQLYINHISFEDLSIIKDTYWSIQGLYCNRIDFIHFRNAGTGSFSNTSGGSFKPFELTYTELLKIAETDSFRIDQFTQAIQTKGEDSANKLLYLRSSDLGKINFVDTDFSGFSLNFYSTKLNEIFLAGSKMPKTVKAIDLDREGTDPKHQERIAYSQLKKLLEQQGDLLASNEYFAGEMNAYYESLAWKHDFWEKLPLFLNRISSNHGQSWIRALVTTVGVTTVFYALFLTSLGILPASPFNSENLGHFFYASSYFFDFVNPLHKLETFAPLKTGSEYPIFGHFVDGIARVFIAYFVYQLIQAFRKHGRYK
ncbi:hypothetical protein [Pedobacter sp.]|uniref:hypothetical protein n=1 Tax=Pedobacter sp. TaxID=1411316 RepID=UPI0031DE4276